MSFGFFFILFNLQKIIHEFGHFFVAKRFGIVVEEFGIGYPPYAAEIGWWYGTRFTFNYLLFGSFIQIAGGKDATIPGGYASKSKLVRLSVLIAGPILSLAAMCIFVTPAIVFFTLAYMAGVNQPVTGVNNSGQEASVATTVVVEAISGSPAEQAGLQPGDIVLGADGVRFKYIGDLVAFVDKMRGQEINLSVKREGRLLTIPVSPRMTFPEDEGSLGIRISYEGVRNDPLYYSLPTAIVKGFRSAVEQSWRILSSPFVVLKQGIVKQATEFERPTGFTENGLIYVGIGESGTALYSIFRFLGVLSAGVIIPITAVTLISLLPLPGWDTWRIIALLFQK